MSPSFCYIVPDSEVPLARDMAGGQGFGAGDELLLPPLDGLYFATVAKEAGWDARLIDLAHAPDGSGETLGPTDYLLVEVQLPTLESDIATARRLKEQTGARLFLHTFVHGKRLLRRMLEASGAEAILRTQDYGQLPDILEGRSSAGTARLEEGRLVERLPSRIPVPDELPVPDRGLLGAAELSYRYPLLPGGPVATVKSSWGCPYPCGYYCPYPLGEGSKAILRGAEHVARELEDIQSRGITRVLFRDATFSLQKKRTREICKEILERGLRLDWWCETRIDLLDAKLMKLMVKAGCKGVNVGIETGDSHLMANALKTGLDRDAVEVFIKNARKLGLECHLLCVLGLPGETRETIRNTLHFLDRVRASSLNFTFATPYPGTDYHRDALEYGWMLTAGYESYAADSLVARSIFLDGRELHWAMEHTWRFIAAYRQGDDSAVATILAEVDAWAGESSWPHVSVVIPTYNRPEKLGHCLERLAKQTLPPHTFEVVVVDDGSDDRTQEILDQQAGECSFDLRVFRQENSGPARARNFAIAKARGRIILFMGDDIYLGPDALQHHVAWHARHPNEVEAMVGVIKWAPKLEQSEFMRWLDKTNLQFGFNEARHGEEQGYGFFYTANLSLKTEFLRKHGVFDESFRHAVWEDIELGYRMEQEGLRIWFNERAEAWHDHVVTLERFAERQRLVGRYTILVLAKHRDYHRRNPQLFKGILRSLTIYSQAIAEESDLLDYDRILARSYWEGLREGFAEFGDQLEGRPDSLEVFIVHLHDKVLERARDAERANAKAEELETRLETRDLLYRATEEGLRNRIENLKQAIAHRDHSCKDNESTAT